jgi:hypothetical protein
MTKLECTRNAAVIAAVMLLTSAGCATAAPPQWTVKGAWNIYFYVQLGQYTEQFAFSKPNCKTGKFTGTSPQGNVVNGVISGSSVNWDLYYDAQGDHVAYEGTVTPEDEVRGTLSGNMQNCGPGGCFQGTFSTISGKAKARLCPQK